MAQTKAHPSSETLTKRSVACCKGGRGGCAASGRGRRRRHLHFAEGAALHFDADAQTAHVGPLCDGAVQNVLKHWHGTGRT